MITPDQIRAVLSDASFSNAYKTFFRECELDRQEKAQLKQNSCMFQDRDKETIEIIKKALKGNPEKRENIILAEYAFFENERELGKAKYIVNCIARCVELKKKFFSQTLEPRIEVLISFPEGKKFELVPLGLHSRLGPTEVPVEYIKNTALRVYLRQD